jgi:hypothetical protein
VYPGQIQDPGDLAHQMIVRHNLIEAERIEQPSLVPIEPPHHHSPPDRCLNTRESALNDPSKRLLQQNLPWADVVQAFNLS